MIELIKRVWSGSFAVKASVVFLALVFLICLIGDPGRTIFTVLCVAAGFAIINRIDGLDDEDNK
jgi:hypothetical protein